MIESSREKSLELESTSISTNTASTSRTTTNDNEEELTTNEEPSSDLEENGEQDVNQNFKVDRQSLNKHSELFDPLFALYSPDLKLINRKCKVFDNFGQFNSCLERLGLYRVCSKKAHAEATALTKQKTDFNIDELTERRFLPHQMPIKSSDVNKPKHNRNLFNKLKNINGPLAVLTNCMRTNRRIKIYIRSENDIRGHTSGYIICFDKHWNIILSDVIETWTRRKYNYGENNTIGMPVDCSIKLRELGIQLPTIHVKSLNRKNIQITRNLAQVLIRGEHVALIAMLNEFKIVPN